MNTSRVHFPGFVHAAGYSETGRPGIGVFVRVLALVAFLVAFVPAISFGEPEFIDMDLSDSNILLFRMRADDPGFGPYDTLFVSNLKTGNISQLTFFPERITYLRGTGQIQIQNRFGVFRTDFTLQNMHRVDDFSSFLGNGKVERGKLFRMITSPDGRYILSVRNARGAVADLALAGVSDKKQTVIIRDADVDFKRPYVVWSDDARFILYTKNNTIHYFSIDQFREDRVLAENIRTIGKGSLASIAWRGTDTLYYLTGRLVYRIHTQEFFTRSLYREILSIGTVLGRVPYEFDPNFDDFWVAPDGKSVLINKGGRNLFLAYLRSDDFSVQGNITMLPYLSLPSSTRVRRVIWSEANLVTILTAGLDNGSWASSVFRLVVPEKGETSAGFVQLKEENIYDMILSPAKGRVALIKKDKVDIKTYDAWGLVDIVLIPSPLDAAFRDESSVVVAGGYSTILYDLKSKKEKLVGVSQVGEFGFSVDGNSVLARAEKRVFRTSVEGGNWSPVQEYKVRERSTASDAYRVYAGPDSNGVFANMIMVRNHETENPGTVPMFDVATDTTKEPMPKIEEKYDLANFNHGSRLRKREVALVFDVVDSIDGLSTVLDTLGEFGLRCTFFINGEAIRRYPGAVSEIAHAGHECGSLFFAFFDMTDSKFMLDKDFIKIGLSTNETEFYNATGKELVLFWHTPYYFVNSKIIEVSREMGYVYAGRDVNTMDWVTENAAGLASGTYMSASRLVEKILADKKPGSIIPINVGTPPGKREDYLFTKLPVLINGLYALGYEIVPISTLYTDSK
jgi:peptidoglycan/xylan/chitin deacetylase (PgdA/CDA1 family)